MTAAATAVPTSKEFENFFLTEVEGAAEEIHRRPPVDPTSSSSTPLSATARTSRSVLPSRWYGFCSEIRCRP